jgi:hypothetical protein
LIVEKLVQLIFGKVLDYQLSELFSSETTRRQKRLFDSSTKDRILKKYRMPCHSKHLCVKNQYKVNTLVKSMCASEFIDVVKKDLELILEVAWGRKNV